MENVGEYCSTETLKLNWKGTMTPVHKTDLNANNP
jgi:hypothetical protein